MTSKDVSSMTRNDALFFNAFQFAAIGMALVAPDGTWLMVNKALCDLLGYDEDVLLKMTFQDITHPDDLEEDLHHVQQVLSGGIDTYQMEKRYFHRNGSTIHVLLSVSLVRDESKAPLFFISQIQNITERKQLEQELLRQATEDMLTGISNRRRFFDLAEREILRAKRYNDPLVLLMMDIDFFKHINDNFGHDIGDKAIRKMADVCRAELRAVDIFGRLGGEEFGVLLIKTDVVMGHQVAERLRQAIERATLPTEKGRVRFTISIGGTAFSGSGSSLENRLKQADQALYQAKSLGRNRVVMTDFLYAAPGEEERLQAGFFRLEWNRSYECGNPQIDSQHRHLFKQANLLLGAMIAQQERVIGRYFKQLISDVSEHFNTEEQFLETIGYPRFDEHRKIHKELADRALKMETLYGEGQLELAQVLHFLTVSVVSRHLLHEDRKFFSYCQGDD